MVWRKPGLAVFAIIFGGGAMAEIAGEEKKSGSGFMSRETQAMQADDTSNPGMFSVLDGERLWREPVGPAMKSCASCHGDAEVSMRGAAARHPAFDETSGKAIDLAGRIKLCRRDKQTAEPFPRGSEELLALTTYVGTQSRGMPVAPPVDERLTPSRENGKRLFEARIGQLDLSCASCHDDNWDKRLGGSPITQAHPTGYPIYRLEWQSVGSLQRRMRNCMVGVRAEPYEFGSQEFIDLEAYLNTRASGLAVETPGVRP
ncbi:sulfur oxidation c-type cytochrome SoxA [Flaviflagellibacter deserti]|uniref:SoxAX cytochrome complex subunit A n=1 Tax=Flaviflagellibacter deserti TaxID=2267266 RepID=A0ABV9Z4W0_9HYPH